MVRLRMAKYCNLKCMLLILVIYGHWIETDIGSSKLLLIQYKWIYFVHMPLFAFLSGLFLGTERDCKNCVKKLLPMYLLLQTVLWAVNRGNMNWFVPWWHLWYLLSNVLWAGMGWLWFRWKKKNSPGSRSGFWKRMCRSTHGCGKETRDVEKESRHRERRWMIFGISLLAGCVAGYCPFIGRWMSLSRTIVFFPYFWMGLICDPAYDWNKMRKYGMI
ncbi:MAG: hypothetical protein IJV50_05930, partial [Lachnospiraceae bacterium]|nr:hypothetical protein [Lachnospiraceae bacterium]